MSFVDPRFTDESSGTSGDDHPHADIRSGELFLAEVYNAVTKSPNWANTMLVVNYDEWGGFYDHVPPANGTGQQSGHRPARLPRPVHGHFSTRPPAIRGT